MHTDYLQIKTTDGISNVFDQMTNPDFDGDEAFQSELFNVAFGSN